MPLLAAILFFLLSVVVTSGVVASAMTVGKQDWAAAGAVAGLVAAALAAIYLIVLLVRIGLGRRLVSTILLGVAAVLVLGGLGGAGLTLSQPLHRAQAASLESSANWNGALSEFKLAGETPPGSHDLARVYDEWGEVLDQKGQFTDAIDKYTTVISDYPNAAAESQRAQADDAKAHYELGGQLANQQQYQAAIIAFEFVTSNYQSSPYAPQSHAAAAKAYLALGETQKAGASCSQALPTYHTLVSVYADTPEGAQAKTELAAPVAVKGVITNGPANLLVALSKSVTGSPGSYVFSADYLAHTDGNGNFSFAGVAQGTYSLAA